MKKLIVTLLCFGVLFASCDVGGKKAAEEERLKQEQEQQRQNIVQPNGTTDAAVGFSNVVFKTTKSDNTWIEMTFSNRNTCTYELKREGVGRTLFSDHTAEYSINGDSITFDYSKQIVARSNASVDNLREIFINDYQTEIKTLEEQLQNTMLNESKRAELTKRITDDKAVIEFLKQGKLDTTLLSETIMYLKQTAAALKAINPVIGTLSDDKKTITVKKLFTELKEGTPEYAENVVFTRE